MQADVTERGPLPELFAIFERIAPPHRAAVREIGGRDRRSVHPPVAAFENFIKGLLAETPATAINYLNAALTRQPTFDRARLALWDVYAEQGDHAARARGRSACARRFVAWARRARFLAGLSQLQSEEARRRLRDVQGAGRQRADADRPQQPRRRAAAAGRHAAERASRRTTSTRRREADPDDPDYFFNLGYAYWLDRDPQAAIYWLREAVRRNPADGDAHFVLGAALAAGGNAAEADAREGAGAAPVVDLRANGRSGRPPSTVPKGLERVKNEVELPHASRIDTKL